GCARSTTRPTPDPDVFRGCLRFSLVWRPAERLRWFGPPEGGRQHRPTSPVRVPRSSPFRGAAPRGATDWRNHIYGRRFHATASGSRGPLRPPDAPMEPEDEALHSW